MRLHDQRTALNFPLILRKIPEVLEFPGWVLDSNSRVTYHNLVHTRRPWCTRISGKVHPRTSLRPDIATLFLAEKLV